MAAAAAAAGWPGRALSPASASLFARRSGGGGRCGLARVRDLRPRHHHAQLRLGDAPPHRPPQRVLVALVAGRVTVRIPGGVAVRVLEVARRVVALGGPIALALREST